VAGIGFPGVTEAFVCPFVPAENANRKRTQMTATRVWLCNR